MILFLIQEKKEKKIIAIAYQARQTASSLGAASYEFPGHGKLPEEKSHVLSPHGFQKLRAVPPKQLPICHMQS
jgi:hypothetical protein